MTMPKTKVVNQLAQLARNYSDSEDREVNIDFHVINDPLRKYVRLIAKFSDACDNIFIKFDYEFYPDDLYLTPETLDRKFQQIIEKAEAIEMVLQKR